MNTDVNNLPDDDVVADATLSAEENATGDAVTVTEDLPDDTPDVMPEVEALVAEAEQRGYLRGRNEALAEGLSRPGLMVEPGVAGRAEAAANPAPDTPSAADELTSRFLTRLRPSVWDI